MKPKFKLKDGRVLHIEEALARGDSFSAMRNLVSSAICVQIRKGMDMDLDGDGDADIYDYAYVEDMYPDTAIYCMGGKLFSITYKIDAKDNVTLGTPVQVEISYVAKTEESHRVPVRLGEALRESSYNSTTGKLTLTVIKPGFNTSKSRYYKESTLKRDHKIFEGAKMFVNHATAAEEKARPEGDVNGWVATINKTWAETDGTIMAEAAVIDPPFKAKLDLLAENKKLSEMGVSIRAIGESYDEEVNGVNTKVVESFIAARSVDFVTYPGAGGRVETIESDRQDANDVDLVTEAQLRSRRPDLVQLVESKITKENQRMKTVEQLTQELKESNEKNTVLEGKLKEAEGKEKKATAAAELSKLLSESKLPETAKERLKKQFASAEDVEGMKEAIVAETEYIKSLGVTNTTKEKNGVRNMGVTESTETSGNETTVDLTESFKMMGLSDEEAKIAAKGRK
jgi:hypothetical protein